MWDPYAEFESVVLPNGLTVYVAHWPGRTWESVGMLVHSGADQDPNGKEGLAHFVEHMVNANTFGGCDSVEEFFKELGGSVMLGRTSFRCTEYGGFLPAEPKLVSQALSIFGNRIFNETLAEGLEHERGVILAEFSRKYSSDLETRLRKEVRHILYSDLPRGRMLSAIGWLDTISAISGEDVQSFYDKHYTPQNVSVVAVGGMKSKEFLSLISASPFAVTREGVRTALPLPLEAPPKLSCTNKRIKVSDFIQGENLRRTAALECEALLPGNLSFEALIIYRRMLQRSLFKEMRMERGLVYTVNVSVNDLGFLKGIEVKCDSFEPAKTDLVAELVASLIDRVPDDEELFEREKRLSIASYLLQDPSGQKLVENALDDLAHRHRIVTCDEEVEKRKLVTLDDIQAISRHFVPEKRLLTIVTP